ncbi:hypothetical protein [Streptomyces fulvorobeus]|uniref:Uncharacterized protein n=1 Tax=Streptomyces fulvorobeus TaxID=284028 RepID=A0A7Y9HAK6_9ACTN|nr:hypothetical protein [Streptomyces fulvorobeus]NYE40818.1 hypothetical protein [Streptomyces fulvorobeus]
MDNFEERPKRRTPSHCSPPRPGAQGPGDTLRIVLIVSIGGATLLGWLLLRGHRNEETND